MNSALAAETCFLLQTGIFPHPARPPLARLAKPRKYCPPCASGNAANLHLMHVTILIYDLPKAAAQESSDRSARVQGRRAQLSTGKPRRLQYLTALIAHYFPQPPSHRYSAHSALSAHVFPNDFLEPATSTPQSDRRLRPQPADPPHPAPPSRRPLVWDNHLKGSSLPRRHIAASATKNHMLNELEFAYTPVRDKVRDLREYL
jgi:hypothetical protein